MDPRAFWRGLTLFGSDGNRPLGGLGPNGPFGVFSTSLARYMKCDGFCQVRQLGNDWLPCFACVLRAQMHGTWEYLEGILPKLGTLQVRYTTHMTIQAQHEFKYFNQWQLLMTALGSRGLLTSLRILLAGCLFSMFLSCHALSSRASRPEWQHQYRLKQRFSWQRLQWSCRS